MYVRVWLHLQHDLSSTTSTKFAHTTVFLVFSFSAVDLVTLNTTKHFFYHPYEAQGISAPCRISIVFLRNLYLCLSCSMITIFLLIFRPSLSRLHCFLKAWLIQPMSVNKTLLPFFHLAWSCFPSHVHLEVVLMFLQSHMEIVSKQSLSSLKLVVCAVCNGAC
jgi:hypothetical protein